MVSEHSYVIPDDIESVYEDANDLGNDNDGNDDGDNGNDIVGVGRELRTAVGTEAVFVALESIGANIIVNGRLDPNLELVAMTNINCLFPVNAIGARAAKWAPGNTTETRYRGTSLRPLECELDGAFFKLLGIKKIHSIMWYAGKNDAERTIRVRAVEVPGFPHTPDFTLERIELGRPFCLDHVVYVDTMNRYIVIRDDNDVDVTLPFQIRRKRRTAEEAERFHTIRAEHFP